MTAPLDERQLQTKVARLCEKCGDQAAMLTPEEAAALSVRVKKRSGLMEEDVIKIRIPA